MNFEDDFNRVVIILGLASIIIGGSLIGFNLYSKHRISQEAIKTGLIQKVDMRNGDIIWVKPNEKMEN